MEDFICLLLTAHGCGHCENYRGNGIIENGKPLMKHSFIETVTKHCACLNIHYKNMSGQTLLIDSVSKFTSVGKKILQEVYAVKNENSNVTLFVSDKTKVKNINHESIKSEGKDVPWQTFLSKKIPLKLSNYTYFFPCFLFISKKNWNKGLEEKDFYALTTAGITKKFPDGTIGLEKTSESIRSRNIKFETLLKDLVDKKVDLDLYLTEKDKPAKKEEFSEDPRDFILKSFEE